ncbi:MAG: carboxypeptidase regulatory-like domain-containing protein [Rivularia sp. ALOHA_DT_140]|nr:carboxypeptidase regulatory-like domain-containing protein [Rivularia sp. ALOHA_DT_140]
MIVIDDDIAKLTVTIDSNSIGEGNTATATVTRNTDTTNPLVVNLLSSDDTQITVPNTITIAAGATSATFNVSAVDDTLIENTQSFNIIASAPGFTSASDSLEVTDNDEVNLTVSLDLTSIAENDGNNAAVGTVTRDVVTNRDLVVYLEGNDTSEITVPRTVTILANQATANFSVNAVDDSILDGNQTVTITARPSESINNVPIEEGKDSTVVEVRDNESPTINLSVDKTILGEGATATGTVTRNFGTDEDLQVRLNSSDTTEATVPTTVTILAGETSAEFTVTGVDDGVNDGSQTVNLTASADGINSGEAEIEVSDINVPDFVVTSLTASNPLLTSQTATFSYEVKNQGLTDGGDSWVDRVYLSQDEKIDENDTLLGEFPLTEANLLKDVSYQRNVTFFAPKNPGQYYLIAQTDAENTIAEGTGLGEQNNTTITPITVTPSYRAVVSTDLEIGTSGTPVTLRGKALSNADDSPVPYEFVTIAVENNGTVRKLSGFTDGNGNFVREFNPLPGEGGIYQINAYFPGFKAEDNTAEDELRLLGMDFNTNQVSQKIFAKSPLTGQVELQNLTDIPLTNLTAELIGVPDSWNVEVNLPSSTLDGSGNQTIDYTITAPDETILSDRFGLKLSTQEGVTKTLPFNVNVERIIPRLTIEPNSLKSSMLLGEQTFVEFNITNQGGAATGDIDVLLPETPWLSLASPGEISSLAPGESSSITLQLTPGNNLDLVPYNGTLVLDAEVNDADTSVPFNFRAISEATGSLQVNALDELYYFTDAQPKLANATITLRDYFTGEKVRTAITDETGNISFDDLAEGYYSLEVRADKHDTYRNNVRIEAGETTIENTFLSIQTVQYSWTVEEIEIEDRYEREQRDFVKTSAIVKPIHRNKEIKTTLNIV